MNSAAIKTLLIYAIVLPLAVLIGWMVSGNFTQTSFTVLASIVFVLLLPVLLKWHYQALLLSWASFVTIFFLPGQPSLWLFMAALNFGIAILYRVMLKRQAFISAPSITGSLLALLAVVLITAKIRGGVGLHAFGGTVVGGKGYIYIAGHIMGYFGIVSRTIPVDKLRKYLAIFFLPGLITIGSTLIYWAGPAFYPLFVLFPVSFAYVQASSEYAGNVIRVAGLAAASSPLIAYLLATGGVRGLGQKWWRFALFFAAVIMAAWGGFRGILVSALLVPVILFFVEGLWRSKFFPVLLVTGGIAAACLFAVTDRLPASIQRSISFLPVNVDEGIRTEAEGSTLWRLEMWRAAWPDLPRYFWIGKGYNIDPTELYLAEQSLRYGRAPNYLTALTAGDTHSGPLSVYMPFGAPGSLAFLFFLGACIRGLYKNYRYGPAELKTVNRFLFVYFVAKAVFFFAAFGALSMDMQTFAGIIGFSVALNKGICQEPVLAAQPVALRGASLKLDGIQPGMA